MLAAFLSDSYGETENHFISTLDQWIRLLVTNGEDIEILQEFITLLHQYIKIKHTQQFDDYIQADTILHRARSFYCT